MVGFPVFICFSIPPEPCLDLRDLKVVLRELFEVRAKWRKIGLELDLTPGTLDAIQQRYLEPEDQLERVLIEWLKTGKASWRQLGEALCSCIVGEILLAKKLRETYCSQAETGNFWYFV